MPANYAHRVFGATVLSALSPSVTKRLEDHLPLFQMGLHGPDLLFYYMPVFSTPLGKLGYSLHSHTGREVISTMLDAIPSLPEEQQDAALSYTMGFICHYLLDSACHPYVEQLVKAGKASHCVIEGEFELWLIVRDEKDPLGESPVSHLEGLDSEDFDVIAPLFAALSKIDSDPPLKVFPRSIAFAHTTMLSLSRIFSSPNPILRTFGRIGLVIGGNYEERQGLLYNKEPNPAFDGCSRQLFALLETAVKEAPAILESVLRRDLPSRLDHSFEG